MDASVHPGIRPLPVTAVPLAWYQGISRQQWLVLIVAFLGWLFDSMDVHLYAMVLFPSLSNLLGTTSPGEIGRYGGFILAIQLTGWASGGIIFGIVADYIGRTKTMIMTILVYCAFTGLSGLSQAWWHLAIFRFLAGLGIGGEWATGVALIAETWPDRSRSKATAIMQCALGVGFFLAAVVNLLLGAYSWRLVFLAGVFPAFVTILILKYIEESPRWLKAREKRISMKTKQPITIAQLFGKDLIRNTLVGLLLAMVGIMGFTGATWLPSWVIILAREGGIKNPSHYVSYVMMMLTLGSLFGYLAIGGLADAVGRKGVFKIYFIGGLVTGLPYFFLLKSLTPIFWLAPFLGFFLFASPAGLAIYLPELFPTAVRATGQGFCFNAGRVIAALGPLVSGFLVAYFGAFNKAAGTICLIYIVGLIVLFFARETKGCPLPD